MTAEQILLTLDSLNVENLQDKCKFGFLVEDMLELPAEECYELFQIITKYKKKFLHVLPTNSYWGKIVDKIGHLVKWEE